MVEPFVSFDKILSIQIQECKLPRAKSKFIQFSVFLHLHRVFPEIGLPSSRRVYAYFTKHSLDKKNNKHSNLKKIPMA